MLAATVSMLTSCCIFGLPWLASCRSCPTNGTCHALNRFRRFHCPAGHYNDLASLFLNINDDAIRNLYSTGTSDVYHPVSMLTFFVASYGLGVLSYVAHHGSKLQPYACVPLERRRRRHPSCSMPKPVAAAHWYPLLAAPLSAGCLVPRTRQAPAAPATAGRCSMAVRSVGTCASP